MEKEKTIDVPEEVDAFENLNNFDKEFDLIDQSINDIDDLYEETKSHYDKVKNSFAKGSLSFIQTQTANLVSLKTAKVNMIKERINIKKIQADLYLKNQRNKPEDGANNDALVAQVAEYLMKNDVPVNQIEDNFIGTVEESVDIVVSNNKDAKEKMTESVDDLIEKRLAELEKSGDIALTDNERAILYENKKVVIKVIRKGKKWKYVGVDQNNKIVKDYPVPDRNENPVKFQRDEEEGTIIAVNEEGRIYDVIIIKEKE